MSPHVFWKTVICGFFATFTMTMIAFVQAGMGLPLIDIGYFLTRTFNHIHQSEVYSIFWGSAAYMTIGVILALFWVAFLQDLVPGNWFIQGVLYGIVITIIAGLFVSPLISAAAGETFGIFYWQTWFPGLMVLAGLIMHIGYGLVLTLSLKVADVE